MSEFPQEVYESATDASETSVAASDQSVLLLPANTRRNRATIRNDSTAVMYISHSATATTAAPVALQAQGIYELPCRYTGAVSAVWASANGSARILEFA